MTWDTTVADFAQQYVDTCPGGHSSSPYGENLAFASFSQEGTGVTGRWMSENADWDCASNSCTPGKVCGHATQVLWEKSVKIGCAVKDDCSSGALGFASVASCNYDPPGNFVGQHPFDPPSTVSTKCSSGPSFTLAPTPAPTPSPPPPPAPVLNLGAVLTDTEVTNGGTVAGAVDVSGTATLLVSGGTVAVSGCVALTGQSTLELHGGSLSASCFRTGNNTSVSVTLGSPGGSSSQILSFSGDVVLDGNLVVILPAGFSLSAGQTYTFMAFTSRGSSTFTSIQILLTTSRSAATRATTPTSAYQAACGSTECTVSNAASASTASPSDDDSTAVIVSVSVTIVIVCAVAAAIIVLLIWRKKRSSSSAADKSGTSASSSYSDPYDRSSDATTDATSALLTSSVSSASASS